MVCTIENIAGGSRRSFRALTSMARYVAENPVFGGYQFVDDRVSPDSQYDDALAVIRYAESARREIGKNDWDEVVRLCVEWFEAEAQ